MRLISSKSLFLTLSLLLTLSASAQTKVVEWTFDGNTNDRSGKGNHAVVSGGEPQYVAGRFGQALARPAAVLLRCAAATDLPTAVNEPWSMNIWLKFDTAVPGWAQLFGFRDNSNGWGTLRVADNEGGFNFYGHNSNLSSGSDWLADNQWHLYSITWDGEKIRLYLDGALKRAGVPGTMEFSGLTALTGADVFLGDATWAGSVDEFTVWSGQLSDQQIRNLFTRNQLTDTAPKPLP